MILAVVIVMAAPISGARAAASGRAGSHQFPDSVPATATHHAIRGDFDGDGKPDLVVGDLENSAIHVTYTHLKIHGKSSVYIAPKNRTQGYGAVLATGDFNGDGYADLAVAAPYYRAPTEDGPVGAFYVLKGSKTGLHAWFVVHARKDFFGKYLGNALAVADFNHDGYSDLAVGQPGNDMQSQVIPGKVLVYPGSSTGLSKTNVQTFRTPRSGYNRYDEFGFALTAADVNGDGHPDLVVGAPLGGRPDPNSYTNGMVQVIDGTARGLGSTRRTINWSAAHIDLGFGRVLASGDVTGDHIADVIVGSPYATAGGHVFDGAISLLRGSKHGLVVPQHSRVSAITLGSRRDGQDNLSFGQSLAVGDINRDGHADVVVGAPGYTTQNDPKLGEAYVIPGSSKGFNTSRPQVFVPGSSGVPRPPAGYSRYLSFGAAVGVVDLNHDRHPDVVIGEPDLTNVYDASSQYPYQGAALEFSGTANGVSRTHIVKLTGHLGRNLGSAVLSD